MTERDTETMFEQSRRRSAEIVLEANESGHWREVIEKHFGPLNEVDEAELENGSATLLIQRKVVERVFAENVKDELHEGR